jgi:ketosteroid isomerase-like protein
MKLRTRLGWQRIMAVAILGLPLGLFPHRWAWAETPKSCAPPAYHEFDFWVGDWEAFDFGTTHQVAEARIESILEGCVLKETYRATDGHQGQSFTIYDKSRNVWHQTWVTDHGALLEIEGKFANGEMVLQGTDQQGRQVRGSWKPENGGVREVAVRSADGKKWEPWFDIVFRSAARDGSSSVRVGQEAGPEENEKDQKGGEEKDREVVGALDSEYQAAVKRNDADAMGNILANDFVLVTSGGKLYTRDQLLEEARGGLRTYEHQEDFDRSVRLWGDTAIVTAKLWEKGTENGKPFEHWLWFSDVYRRTPAGWRYVFAQSAYRPDQNLR